MKIKDIITITCLILGVSSCKGDIEISEGLEEFNVTTEKNIYKVNEEVMFNFDGNPDMISFYSGELYNDYDFRESRVIELQKSVVSFTSQYPNPTLLPAQVATYKVLVSTDFNNNYTYESVMNATWHDITSEFEYGDATSKASGAYEISELYEEGKPLYFAFRSSALPQEINGKVNRRLFQNFQMSSTSIFGNHIIGNMTSSDFIMIEKNDAKTSSTLSTTTITFDRYVRALQDDPDPETDTWVVSKPFDLNQIDNGPDRAVPLKGNLDPILKNHIYVFKESGEYMVTFLGINGNVHGRKEVVKQLKIIIEE